MSTNVFRFLIVALLVWIADAARPLPRHVPERSREVGPGPAWEQEPGPGRREPDVSPMPAIRPDGTFEPPEGKGGTLPHGV